MQTKLRKEPIVFEQLCIRKIEVYYPRIQVESTNPRACALRSYFPGYLFVRVDLGQIGPNTLQWIPGTVGLVGYGSEPIDVPDNLISVIRKKVDYVNRNGDKQIDDLKTGETVVISSGSLAGYRAIFDSHLPGYERVRVLLKILHDRQVCIVLPKGQLERINQH
jgi:transcriptional antiterminator RfaH